MICLVIILGIVCILEFTVIFRSVKVSEEKSQLGDIVEKFRRLWGGFVLYVVATSIIGLFLGSIFFEKVIGLNEINSWVSVILGLIALVISVISLFLSFYNVDQSNAIQKETIEIMNAVKNDIKNELNDVRDRMNTGFSEVNKNIYRNNNQSSAENLNEGPVDLKTDREWERI